MIDRVNHDRGSSLSRDDLSVYLLISDPRLQGINWAGEIWDLECTVSELEQILTSIVINQAPIEVEYDVALPERGVFSTKVTVKNRGQVWRLHQNDADHFPSHPHAHNIELCLKLDLRTGGLYRGKSCVSCIPKKQLREVRWLFEQRGAEMPAIE